MLAKYPSALIWMVDVAISQTYVGAILKQPGQQDQAKEHVDKARLLMGKAKLQSGP